LGAVGRGAALHRVQHTLNVFGGADTLFDQEGLDGLGAEGVITGVPIFLHPQVRMTVVFVLIAHGVLLSGCPL
jgi:hypothetical protein